MVVGAGRSHRDSSLLEFWRALEFWVLLDPLSQLTTSVILAPISALGKDSEGKICPVGYWLDELSIPFLVVNFAAPKGPAYYMFPSNA